MHLPPEKAVGVADGLAVGRAVGRADYDARGSTNIVEMDVLHGYFEEFADGRAEVGALGAVDGGVEGLPIRVVVLLVTATKLT